MDAPIRERAGEPQMAQLAGLVAPHFTVFYYDRRGRGDSTDTQPYAIEREIEDTKILKYLHSIGLDTLGKIQQTFQPMLRVGTPADPLYPVRRGDYGAPAGHGNENPIAVCDSLYPQH